jgi:hypothetical protein
MRNTVRIGVIPVEDAKKVTANDDSFEAAALAA